MCLTTRAAGQQAPHRLDLFDRYGFDRLAGSENVYHTVAAQYGKPRFPAIRHAHEQVTRKERLLNYLFAVLPLMHFAKGGQVILDAFFREDRMDLRFAIGSRADGVPFMILRHSSAPLLTGIACKQ